MAGAAVLGRLTPLRWLLAELVELAPETPRVSSLVLDVPGWAGHRPGQHVDVRLTAEDGYQAERSYSIATPADGERLVLTVEELADGRGGERIAALRLITTLSGQADVDVLAGAVTGPARDVEDEARDARRLRHQLNDLREEPAQGGQSPQYRCSRHGSP